MDEYIEKLRQLKDARKERCDKVIENMEDEDDIDNTLALASSYYTAIDDVARVLFGKDISYD